MQITSEEITVISRLIDDLCGIVLDETKAYLIENRLSTVAAEAGCETFTELYYKARYAKDKGLQNNIINAITTNETLFFRDSSPFEVLKHKVIPDLIDQKASTSFPKRIRIWSAACSTRQEPYSIAITLHEMLPDIMDWDIQILATDISDSAIKQASRGTYATHEIHRGMKIEMLNKYFTQTDDQWKVKDELRALIAFKNRNLLDMFTDLRPFDIILCRNVAIYFKPDARKDLFQRLAEKLTPTGYLFAGSTESLKDVGSQFVPQYHCRSCFYQPNHSLPVTSA